MQVITKHGIQIFILFIAWLFVMMLYVVFPIGILIKLTAFCHSMSHWIAYNMFVIYGIALVLYLRYGLTIVRREFALFATVVFPGVVLGGEDATL